MLVQRTGVRVLGTVVSEKLGNRCTFERCNEQWRGLFFKADQPCQKIYYLIISSCLHTWGLDASLTWRLPLTLSTIADTKIGNTPLVSFQSAPTL